MITHFQHKGNIYALFIIYKGLVCKNNHFHSNEILCGVKFYSWEEGCDFWDILHPSGSDIQENLCTYGQSTRDVEKVQTLNQMTEWLKIGIISSLLDISSEVECACVGLTSWQSSRELTSWAFWQERMEPARLSITHTADRSMKNVICGREEGGKKGQDHEKM